MKRIVGSLLIFQEIPASADRASPLAVIIALIVIFVFASLLMRRAQRRRGDGIWPFLQLLRLLLWMGGGRRSGGWFSRGGFSRGNFGGFGGGGSGGGGGRRGW